MLYHLSDNISLQGQTTIVMAIALDYHCGAASCSVYVGIAYIHLRRSVRFFGGR